MFFKNSNSVSPAALFTLLVFCLVVAQADRVSAQALTPKTSKASNVKATPVASTKIVLKDMTPSEQEALANSIWKKTKTADSANKLGEIVDGCRDALKTKLTEANETYFKSLLAWALSKRGDKRMDSYQQLLAVGNDRQAKTLAQNAKQDLNEAIELDNKNWRSYLNRGIIQGWLGDHAAAAKDFEKVCELEKSKSYGWFNLAEIQFEMEQFADAKANYEKALEISKSDVQSITGVAHCLARLKEHDKSAEKYTVVIRLRPDSSEALINRGDVYAAQKKWKDALDDYSKAAETDSNPTAYQRAAWLMASCPEAEFFQPETALLFANKAKDSDKVSKALALDTLAAAQAACGDFESAISSQRKALALTDTRKSAALEARLKLYQAETPFQQAK